MKRTKKQLNQPPLLVFAFGLLLTGLGFLAGYQYHQAKPSTKSLAKLSVPEVVQEKYHKVYEDYSKSMGAQLDYCQSNSGNRSVYVVAGNGGYTGVSYYYEKDGRLIGESKYSDVPDDTNPKPPVNLKDYDCSALLQTY